MDYRALIQTICTVTDKKSTLREIKGQCTVRVSQLDMWPPALVELEPELGTNDCKVSSPLCYIVWLSEEPYIKSITAQIKGQKISRNQKHYLNIRENQ